MRVALFLLLPFLVFGQNKMPLKYVAPFSPSTLTPLVWYDSRPADMASDGTHWNDVMGFRNLTVIGGDTAPTYNGTALNGLPGMVFDGIANTLSNNSNITSLNGAAHITYWMVSKQGGVSYDHGTPAAVSLDAYNAANKTQLFLDAVGNKGVSTNANTTTGFFHYHILLYDGTQSTNATKMVHYLDGATEALTFTGTIPATSSTDASQILKMGTVVGVAPTVGTVCEWGIVARTITAGEIASLNSYLAAKYGL